MHVVRCLTVGDLVRALSEMGPDTPVSIADTDAVSCTILVRLREFATKDGTQCTVELEHDDEHTAVSALEDAELGLDGEQDSDDTEEGPR